MAIDFPSTGLVANTTTYSFGSLTWIWNGTSWDTYDDQSISRITTCLLMGAM